MAKLKLTNKTTNNFWLSGYCFVPGVTTTGELTLEEEVGLRNFMKNESIAERIKDGKISFSFLGQTKIKNAKDNPKDTPEVEEEKTEGDGGLI
ncbi:MAG: hypothetical protein ACRCX2_09030 [Paraclostridium sp.]|uniref:hypothetical protein n=1 Tax=Cetobacterium sp. TaxID=2071632 RepID=UPI003F40F302